MPLYTAGNLKYDLISNVSYGSFVILCVFHDKLLPAIDLKKWTQFMLQRHTGNQKAFISSE